ncbi:hypothetical protein N0V88_002165 [Collariella sp. IMI 366227]|nr:hypothetical protein N0V88_002165 [Collariella sp. IMI 366227]
MPSAKKASRQAASAGKLVKRGGAVAKSDARHGARPGLMPTSGPRKPVSAKRQRKLEKKMGYALKRKMERRGDAPAEKGEKKDAEAEMDIVE